MPYRQRHRVVFLPVSAKDLIAWRKHLGWTQLQAATYLNVQLATYRNWEQDKRDPTAAMGPVRKLMDQARRDA